MFEGFLTIDEHSKIPKYQQVVDTIVSDIDIGLVKVGDKIPSINETSEEYYISRDTVEKAYKILRRRGIITAVRGKGFYVASTGKNEERRVLLVFNKLSDHKKTIYNSFVKHIGAGYHVDLQVHNCDSRTLEKIVIENLGRYDHYVVMPHLLEETASVKSAINKIPKERVVLLNKDMDGIDGEYACVFEDFELDIHQALCTGIDKIRKYHKLVLIFPTDNFYCTGIRKGFVNFCEAEGFDFEVIERAYARDVRSGELYIAIEEVDLVEVIKKANAGNLKLGKNIGVMAYNDTPFKEILAGGITVLSTDFAKMGETLADMVCHHKREHVKNPFKLIVRNSV
ncbi:MAG: GntR family transcriptional regulator [Bacteroidia bacterium]|nr:GntR family transcriptional regulator [Bacteroidia bacterium]